MNTWEEHGEENSLLCDELEEGKKKNVNENGEFMHTQEQEREKKNLCVKKVPSFDNKTKKKEKKSLSLTSNHQDLRDV